MVEFVFSLVGYASAVVGLVGGVTAGYIAVQRWRKRRHLDQATRRAFAQVGANAAWARGENPTGDETP